MEVFAGGRLAEVVALRLDRGDDVLDSISQACQQLGMHTAVVISGIGTLDQARLHHITGTEYPPQDAIVRYEGPIELLSIDGLIADHTPHLHTSISIKETTYMGHLEPGCRVLYLAEIVIARVEDLRLCRKEDLNTGIRRLQREASAPT